MSTKVAGLSSSYYFSCNARSDHAKTGINSSILIPTIKRSIMIDKIPHLFKFSAQYGNPMVISRPGKFQAKASATPNSSSSSSSWKKWLLGMLLIVFVPIGYKGGQILYLKSKIEKAVKTAEHVVETVEEVAEEAEKMVEEVGKRLPADSKLKKTVESFDDVAKEAVIEAKKAEEVVHKVKDMEGELEKRLMKAAVAQFKK